MFGRPTIDVYIPSLMQVQAAELAVQIDQAMVRFLVTLGHGIVYGTG